MTETTNKTSGLTPEQIAQIAAQAASSAVSKAVEDKSTNANEAALKINNKVHEQQLRQQAYAKRIKEEMDANINCTTIIIPEMFKRWQPTFTVCINGCTVSIPANGKPYKVHWDFANIIESRMARISKKVSLMETPDISEYSRD